jgi:hypothetical protein
MKVASVLSVVLCVIMTLAYVLAGGQFSGPSTYVYFVMLVICIAVAVGLASQDSEDSK